MMMTLTVQTHFTHPVLLSRCPFVHSATLQTHCLQRKRIMQRALLSQIFTFRVDIFNLPCVRIH